MINKSDIIDFARDDSWSWTAGDVSGYTSNLRRRAVEVLIAAGRLNKKDWEQALAFVGNLSREEEK